MTLTEFEGYLIFERYLLGVSLVGLPLEISLGVSLRAPLGVDLGVTFWVPTGVPSGGYSSGEMGT